MVMSINRNSLQTMINRLSFSARNVKLSLKNGVSRISDFVQKNKTTVFFGATIAFSLLTAPVALANASVGSVMVGGAFSACVIHGLTVLFDTEVKGDKSFDDKMNILLGLMNICARYLSPAFGVATSLYTLGMKGCSLIYRQISQIK